MNFTPLELELCKAWAIEHEGEDSKNLLDAFHWKLLKNGREKSERSARFHSKTVDEIDKDMAPLSAKFYKSETPEPNGDELIDF